MYPKNKNIPLIALCLGFFMVVIDLTIVNVALPDMAKNLNGSVSWLQWVVDGYTLTFACLLLSVGHFSDRFGAKIAFQCGLTLFILTSIACGYSSSFLILTIFRLLQGVAAALLVPTSLTLINASYETNEERAKAIGIWASIGGIAAAAGPLLGGILTSWFGWRAVFFVNVPFGIVGAVLTAKYVLNPMTEHKDSHFDFAGQILGIISIASLAFGLIEAGRAGWLSLIVLSALSFSLVTFVLFLVVEHRTRVPMFPLNLFHSKTFSVAIIVGMLMTLSCYGEQFVLTLYFQQIRDYSAMTTGFAFMPYVGVIAISSYFGGKVTSISGPRWPMVIGLGVGTLGFLSLLIANQLTPYWMLILPLAAMGFGISFTQPAVTTAAIHSAPKNKAGIASGAFNASRQVGALLGIAIFGTLVTSINNFIHNMQDTLILGGLLFFISCVMAFFTLEK